MISNLKLSVFKFFISLIMDSKSRNKKKVLDRDNIDEELFIQLKDMYNNNYINPEEFKQHLQRFLPAPKPLLGLEKLLLRREKRRALANQEKTHLNSFQ